MKITSPDCHCHLSVERHRRLVECDTKNLQMVGQTDIFMSHPATATWVGQPSLERRCRVPNKAATDLSGLRRSPLCHNQCCRLLFGSVFLHLYALLTVTLVLDLSSRLICSQDICSRSTVCTSDMLTSSFARYKFVTYVTCDRARPAVGHRCNPAVSNQ